MSEVKERIKSKDVQWANTSRPREMETTLPDGRRLRIHQSVGRDDGNTFWFCYHMPVGEGGWRYVGVEKQLELAKSRALSGRMRMPSEELEEWLKRHGDFLPDDLLAAENKRLAEWRKNPKPRAALEADIPSPRSAGGRVRAAESPIAAPSGANTEARRPKAEKAEKAHAAPGKVSQSAVIRVVKREPTGKPGTKWRTRQEAVFALDGKTVATAKDNDAIKHMIADGTIKLEEK